MRAEALHVRACCPRSSPDVTRVRHLLLFSPLQGKTNFFERRVGEYQKAGVMAKAHGAEGGGGAADGARKFALDADF